MFCFSLCKVFLRKVYEAAALNMAFNNMQEVTLFLNSKYLRDKLSSISVCHTGFKKTMTYDSKKKLEAI